MGDSRSHGEQSGQSRRVTMRHAWYTVGLLFLLYVFSILDRAILALLAEPVAQSLSLTDSQVALLLGLGFALFYAVAGLPLAHLTDTRDRRLIVTVGVIVWSLSTMLSSMATSFWMLLLLRCGVALGEAALTPAAISLIADMFAREKRALPMSVYTSVGSFMQHGSYLIGALVYGASGELIGLTGMEAWQLTFLFVGTPSLVLAVIFLLTAANPERGGSLQIGKSHVSWAHFSAFIKSRFAFYGPLLAIGGIYSLGALSVITWMPTLLIRTEGYTLAEAGSIIGTVGIPCTLVGTFLWPTLANLIDRRWENRGVALVLLTGAILSAPAWALGIMLGGTANLVLFGIAVCGGATVTVVAPIGFQQFGPQLMRARMAAVNLLLISILGYGLGPLVSVKLGEYIGGSGETLHVGLIITCACVAVAHIAMAIVLLSKSHLAQLQA